MGIKRTLIKLVPDRFQIPLRFRYRKFRGRLEQEFSILDRLAGGGVAIDAGANMGLFGYALSKLCQRVEMFEPNQACTRFIRKLNAKNIVIHNEGLSSAEETMKLYIPKSGEVEMTELARFRDPGGERRVIEARVRRLDAYSFTGVTFIKIDVEGHEREVIRGGEETIKRERPVMLIEVEQRHLDIPMDEVFREITGLGYRGFFIYMGAVHTLPEFVQKVHQCPSINYVNNFIFIPDGPPNAWLDGLTNKEPEVYYGH